MSSVSVLGYCGRLTTGYRAVVTGSTHHAFSDVVVLPILATQRSSQVGTIAADRMVHLTSALVSTFFDVFLRSVPAPRLQRVSAQFPEITIQSTNRQASPPGRKLQ
jgi:hypothetical protein